MAYYISTRIDDGFESAVDKTINALSEQGFGVLTDIDMKATFKKKLDKDFKNYRILGACNPGYAYKAVHLEDKIGALLPCNVTVIEQPDGTVEIAAIDPIAMMAPTENDELNAVADDVRILLNKALMSIK